MPSQDTPEYVLYLRKSKGRAGIGRQRTTTTAHINKLGGRIIAEFVDTDSTAYRKAGGAQPKRDNFTKMIETLRATNGLGVAAWHADRLTRNSEDTERLIEVCSSSVHPIETPSGGGYDLSAANGRRRFRQDAVDANYEVDHGRERTLAAKAEAVAEGRWLGGRRPFGWRPDKKASGGLVLDLTEAAYIAGAHWGVLTGKSLHGIARDWNAAGMTTSTGKRWTPVEVRRVLLRTTNAARPPAKWPPIVDESAHRNVVGLLSRTERRTTTGPERRHLLSGIARCGVCGAGLICSSVGSKRGGRQVYRCRADDGGTHVMRAAAALEEFIETLVIGWFSLPETRSLRAVKKDGRLGQLRRQRAAVEEAMRSSNELRRRKLLTDEEFAEERAEHMATLADLDAKIAAAEAVDVVAPMFRDPAKVWEELDLDRRRAVIAALMTITVGPAPKGRPKGWVPGTPYFDGASVAIEWRR